VDTLSLLPLGVLAIVLIVEARMWNRC
jgi:hypothetical protein